MNFFDIVILVALVLAFIKGVKNGLIKEALSLIANIAALIFANMFKGYLALYIIKYIKLPEMITKYGNFDGFRIMTAKFISFLIIWIVLAFLFSIIIKLLSTLEDVTVGGITKYLGGLLSFLKTYILIFFIIFGLSLVPIKALNSIKDSKTGNFILNKTPILSNFMSDKTGGLEKIIQALDKIGKGESIENIFDLNDTELVKDFILNNHNLIEHVITPEMVKDIIGTETISLAQVNNMFNNGDIDEELISSFVTPDLVSSLINEKIIDGNEIKELYQSGQLDSKLTQEFLTVEVIQVLVNDQVFSLDEVKAMYEAGDIVGDDILDFINKQ